MSVDGWTYYNHAMIPDTAPHSETNMMPVYDGSIWRDRRAFFIRWSTDWDLKRETEWWYVIKDSPFDISKLKSKRRYEINKGKKFFRIERIKSEGHEEELYNITVEAFSAWNEKYRPIVEKDSFFRKMKSWDSYDIFAAYEAETDEMKGYATINDYGDYADFSMLRVNPEFERKGINAALVTGILEAYNSRFDGSFYICDGSRAIRHETAFQDYLEKYFGFRKAYCKLNIRYRWWIRVAVTMLFPFRNVIGTNNDIGSKVTAVLKMEQIRRSFRK